MITDVFSQNDEIEGFRDSSFICGVGFIQDKKFFSSALQEVFDISSDKKERFHCAHLIGWVIAGFAILLFVGAVLLGVGDGIKNDFGF